MSKQNFFNLKQCFLEKLLKFTPPLAQKPPLGTCDNNSVCGVVAKLLEERCQTLNFALFLSRSLSTSSARDSNEKIITLATLACLCCFFHVQTSPEQRQEDDQVGGGGPAQRQAIDDDLAPGHRRRPAAELRLSDPIFCLRQQEV